MTALDLHNTLPVVAAELSPDEQRRSNDLRAHRAMGLLMQLIPVDMPFALWQADGGVITAMYNKHAHKDTDDQARGHMRRLAQALDGFEYTERTHNATQNKVAIIGTVAGVDAELWVLLTPCHCRCHGASDGAR